MAETRKLYRKESCSLQGCLTGAGEGAVARTCTRHLSPFPAGLCRAAPRPLLALLQQRRCPARGTPAMAACSPACRAGRACAGEASPQHCSPPCHPALMVLFQASRIPPPLPAAPPVPGIPRHLAARGPGLDRGCPASSTQEAHRLPCCTTFSSSLLGITF